LFLSKAQYLSLCKSCDDILNDEPHVERISISWLHIIREHPVFLDQYKQLFIPGLSSFGHFLIRSRKGLVYHTKIVLHLIRSLFYSKNHFFQSGKIAENVDFFFISHCISTSNAGSADDFYFDKVIPELKAKGYNVVVGLVNHTGADEQKLSLKWENSPSPRIIFSRTLNFWSEVKFYMALLRQSWKIKKRGRNLRADYFQYQLHQYAAIEAFAGNSLSTLRRYHQVFEFIRIYQPKNLITTYEGHAWERLAFAAARMANPQILCKAYQHAALFKLQHAICRNLADEFNPDQILVSGQNSYKRMISERRLQNIPVQILGSNRGDNGLMSNVIPRILENKNAAIHVLVLPEGITEECMLLFEYALVQAIQNPDISFVWRLHPLISREELIKKNGKIKDLPANIRWSGKGENITDQPYTHVLYRGTTMVIQAVLNGLQPVYLERESEMTIDLLYETNEFKIIANNHVNLKNQISDLLAQNSENLEGSFFRLRAYCLNYYSSFNSTILG
jgi:hypothetical protein